MTRPPIAHGDDQLTMSRPPHLLSLWLLLLLVGVANALHFYLDANEKRCFLEEVPSDTVVEGRLPANTHLFATSDESLSTA